MKCKTQAGYLSVVLAAMLLTGFLPLGQLAASPLVEIWFDNPGLFGETGQWQPMSTVEAPAGRYGHTIIWTGREMIVWGGYYHLDHFLNDGYLYDPAADTWTPISMINAPIGRLRHTAVWTGQQMIVWGGESGGGGVTTNTGGRYDLTTDTWSPISLVNAPSPRQQHSAVWTGKEMIVWGGCPTVFCTQVFNDGGRYDPATDTWVPIAGMDEHTRRHFHQAVWTGDRMIIWGGSNNPQGMSYNPGTNTWTPISTINAPVPTYQGTGVWTGAEMIVWGGCTVFSTTPCTSFVNSGGRYNPTMDIWTPVTTAGVPSPRWTHTAVWTGREMIIWGGCGGQCFDTGASYNPETDTWTPLNQTNAPTARSNHEAVWTGEAMVVWGGCNIGGCGDAIYFNTGGQYRLPFAPPIREGRIAGGGGVVMSNGTQVTHGFELHCDTARSPNTLQVNWGNDNRFHLESLTTTFCSDDPNFNEAPPVAGFDTYQGTGTGRYNGVSSATAEWTFTDAGEPGKNDFAKIVIKDASGNIVLDTSGNLNRGNHQARKK